MSPKPDPQRIADELAKASGTVQAPPPTVPYKQPGRAGKAAILSWHDPAVARQLKILAAEKETTQQKLITEALNLLFAKHGKQRIA